MAVLGAPVFPHGNLAFFVAIFSEMTRLSAGVGLRLHSIHPSITRESKWRYIMKKINLRELSRKIDSKKRQLHTMGNWRNKNNHNSSVLIGMIMPIDNHISPEEGQGFF